MMPDSTTTSRLQRRLEDDRYLLKATWLFGLLGVGAAVLGIVVGFQMVLHGENVPCFESDDGICHQHPRAGVGGSIILISLALTALIMLLCLALLMVPSLRRRRG